MQPIECLIAIKWIEGKNSCLLTINIFNFLIIIYISENIFLNFSSFGGINANSITAQFQQMNMTDPTKRHSYSNQSFRKAMEQQKIPPQVPPKVRVLSWPFPDLRSTFLAQRFRKFTYEIS